MKKILLIGALACYTTIAMATEIINDTISSGTTLLSMDEAVMGYNIRPKTQYTSWRPGHSELTYLEKGSLVGKNVETKSIKTILSLQDLNAILSSSLKGWPNFEWQGENLISMMNGGDVVVIDIAQKCLIAKYKLPKGAANIVFNKSTLGIAYTKDNNLFYDNGTIHAVTNSTDAGIVCGQSVSRNEFGINSGIFFSPDGKKIAFYKKDERDVTKFPLLDINSRTGSLVEIKYPMNGMKSEHVSVGVYDIESKNSVFLNVDDFDDERYLTNVTWAPASDYIYIQVLNRAQKEMHLNRYRASDGSFDKLLFVERDDRFVEPQFPLEFLKNDASKFLYVTNVRDGFANIYLYNTDGKMLKRVTPVDADVTYIGNNGKTVFYTSAEVSPVESQLFAASLSSGKATRLTQERGIHSVSISPDYKYFTDEYSNLNTPRVKLLKNIKGNIVQEIYVSANPMSSYSCGEVSIGTIKSADGQFDNYYRLTKPVNFDSTKVYPVVLYVYGGPHSQLVKDTWLAGMSYWEMYMAERGYVVFVMDNRGTQNRGAEYERAIHKMCGKAEMADQMVGMEWLLSHKWADKSRVGVHGWSYGGFMTISLLVNYPEVFKVGVAGGPVIDWKWYEIMYGERYMETAASNAEGFAKTSLINRAKDLKSKLLICQGAIDKTVVWEHSLSFIRECIKNDVAVDYFPYPCAEHNVMGKDRIHLMRKVTNYFEDYL